MFLHVILNEAFIKKKIEAENLIQDFCLYQQEYIVGTSFLYRTKIIYGNCSNQGRFMQNKVPESKTFSNPFKKSSMKLFNFNFTRWRIPGSNR